MDDRWCVLLLMPSLIVCATHAHMLSSCASYGMAHEADVSHKLVRREIGAPNLRVAMKRSGNDVTLKCRARGTPRPTVYWYKNDKPTTISKKGHIVVRNAKPTSSAVYICQAVNKYGELNWTFVINVTVLQGGDTSISTENLNNPFYIRKRMMPPFGIRSLHCRCLVEHDQMDDNIPSVEEDGQFTNLNMDQVQTVSKLSLSHVTRPAAGVFVCSIRYSRVAYRTASLGLIPGGGRVPDVVKDIEPDINDPDLATWLGATTFENPEDVKETIMAMETRIQNTNSAHRVYVKGIVWSVVMSFIFVTAGCCCLVGIGIRKAYKTDEMISDKIDLT